MANISEPYSAPQEGLLVADTLEDQMWKQLKTVLARHAFALSTAGLLLVFGYLAMLGFWINSNYDGVRGLRYFPSATWGDGLFLPVAAFALVTLCTSLSSNSGASPTRHRWQTVGAVVAGSIAGSLIVILWLMNPAPVINWTLPRAHAFNSAGWYHASFLIATSGLFAGLWIELLRRLRRLRRLAEQSDEDAVARINHFFVSPWLGVLIAGTEGYAILAIYDGARAGVTRGGLPSLIALLAATAFLVALFALTLGTQSRRALMSIGAGCLAATPLSIIFLKPPQSTVGFVNLFAAALAGIALVATEGGTSAPRREDGSLRRESKDPHQTFWIEALIVPGLLMASIIIFDELVLRSVWAGFLVAAGLIVLPVFLRLLRTGRVGIDGRYLVSWGITAALLSACLCAAWLADGGATYYVTGGFVLTIVGTILGGIFLPSYRADFEWVMRLENDLAREDAKPSLKESARVHQTWTRIVGYSTAAFAALLALTIALAPSLNWTLGDKSLPQSGWVAMLILTVLILIAAFRMLGQTGLREPPTPPMASIVWEVVPYVGLCVVAAAVAWIDLGRNGRLNWLAAGDALLLAAFLANCMIGNGARLHLAPLGIAARVCIGMGALADFSLLYWSLTCGMTRDSALLKLGPSLWAFVVAAVLAGMIAASGTAIVYGLGRTKYRTTYPPAGGIRQDVYLCTALWFTLGWLPQVVWAHIENGDERIASVGSVMAGFLLLFGPAFLWVLENNDTHNGRQRAGFGMAIPSYAAERASTYTRIHSLPARVVRHWFRGAAGGSENERRIDALDGHTATQNLLALILAASTIVGGVGIASAATQKEP